MSICRAETWVGMNVLSPLLALEVEFPERVKILEWLLDFWFQQKQKWHHLLGSGQRFWRAFWITDCEHVHSCANSPQLWEPSVRRSRAQTPKEKLHFFFLYYFCQNWTSFNSLHAIGSLRELSFSLIVPCSSFTYIFSPFCDLQLLDFLSYH